MSNITWYEKNGKFIIHKDGVYLALTPEQVTQMRGILEVIEQIKWQKAKEGKR